ncbi:MAG: hypothetical protein R3C53_17945 [Pirellulaceae bacterium]
MVNSAIPTSSGSVEPPREPTAQSAVEILTQQVKWPTGTFRSSEHRFRGQQYRHGMHESMTDTEIQDSVRGAYMTSNSPQMVVLPKWQTDFTAVNVADVVPFGGTDGHYFYLIGGLTQSIESISLQCRSRNRVRKTIQQTGHNRCICWHY